MKKALWFPTTDVNYAIASLSFMCYACNKTSDFLVISPHLMDISTNENEIKYTGRDTNAFLEYLRIDYPYSVLADDIGNTNMRHYTPLMSVNLNNLTNTGKFASRIGKPLTYNDPLPNDKVFINMLSVYIDSPFIRDNREVVCRCFGVYLPLRHNNGIINTENVSELIFRLWKHNSQHINTLLVIDDKQIFDDRIKPHVNTNGMLIHYISKYNETADGVDKHILSMFQAYYLMHLCYDWHTNDDGFRFVMNNIPIC